MYQQAGSKVGAWIDKRVPLFKKIGGAFRVIETVTKAVGVGATLAAVFFGAPAAVDTLSNDNGPCHKGYTYNEAIEGDAVRRTCYDADTGWSVLLAPDGKTCESGLNTRNPSATPVDCSAIPGW